MRERVYKSPLSWKKEMLKTEICLITKFKTWTWNAAKRFSKGAHYYTVKSAYISLEINLDPQRTTLDARRTTHDARRTTHDPRPTTHDPPTYVI